MIVTDKGFKKIEDQDSPDLRVYINDNVDKMEELFKTRVNAITSHATPSINTDTTDLFDITALAEAITNMSTNLTGTPTNGQKLIVRIKDNGTAREIAWGTSFVAGGVALPTTTVANKILTVGFMCNTANSLNKFMCIAMAQEA